MIDIFIIFVKKYSPAGDGEPAEEWTIDTVQDSSLEVMIKRYQNLMYEKGLKGGDIEFINDEVLSSGIRMVKFKVYAR